MGKELNKAGKEILELNDLENRVWQDIARARSSYSVFSLFVKPLFQKSSRHFRNRDIPLRSAIVETVIDSSISSLGRLLQPTAKDSECTLLKYKNCVQQQLKISGPNRSESDYSKTRGQVYD